MLIVPRRRVAAGDPNFANVSLLLHGDGANGSTTIIDSSPSPKTVTAVGNAQISTLQSRFGGASILLNTTGNLTVPNNQSFNFGSGNFTIEGWIHLNSRESFAVIAGVWDGTAGGSSWLFSQGESANPGFLRFGVAIGSVVTFVLSTSIGLPLATWNHVAVVRSGGALLMFSGGINVYTGSISGALNSPSTLLSVNSVSSNQFRSNQYMDDFRITKGIARYEVGTGANAGKMVHAGTNILALPTAPFPDA